MSDGMFAAINAFTIICNLVILPINIRAASEGYPHGWVLAIIQCVLIALAVGLLVSRFA